MASSLFALLDDIATVLDDVAVLTKVAAKKTAGVLGDDLALNAQQVSGVKADRELPVVWAVCKGSLINKVILVPVALILSATMPWLITPLLMLGGAYLCFEGFEKVAHHFLHKGAQAEASEKALMQALMDPSVDLVALEKDKIKGAIRTDFVLSAEIIAITLGTVQSSPFATQVSVLIGIALLMTIGVYGLVAGIVKIDDLGLYLSRLPHEGAGPGWRQRAGLWLLDLAPWLMKTLSVVGTLAMFMVGGSIVVHGLPWIHHLLQPLMESLGSGDAAGFGASLVAGSVSLAVDVLSGLVVGALAFALVLPVQKMFQKSKPSAAH
jgi:predicted DNA repair protein MutK